MKDHRNMQEIIGNKYIYLTYCVRLVGINVVTEDFSVFCYVVLGG